jgi:hypothetical protein
MVSWEPWLGKQEKSKAVRPDCENLMVVCGNQCGTCFALIWYEKKLPGRHPFAAADTVALEDLKWLTTRR